MTMQSDILGRQALVDGDRGRAALFLQSCNLAIIKNQAMRRQKVGKGDGDRGAIGMARARAVATTLTERRPDGDDVPVTLPGYKTAVRALPHALACLDPNDPRRRAAQMFADACERIDASGGSAFGQGADTKGGISDGGVTTRIKHAARYRMIEAIANGWHVDSVTGKITRGTDRVIMRVQRKSGNRQEIKAFALLFDHCVSGLDHSAILRAHGWSEHSKNTRPMIEATWYMLGQIACAWGFDMIGFERKGVDS